MLRVGLVNIWCEVAAAAALSVASSGADLTGQRSGAYAPVAASIMHDIWAVAQIVPCIHKGNCPSSWATAQGGHF